MPLSGIRPPSRLFLIRFYGIRQVLCNDYRSPLLFRIVLFSGSFFQCLQKDCNLFLFFFHPGLKQDQVQTYCNNCSQYNRGFSKNSRHPCWKCGQSCICLGNPYAKCCCQTYNRRIPIIHLCRCHKFHSGHSNRCKNRHSSPTKYTLWNGSQKCGKLWHKSGNPKKCCCKTQYPAVDYLGGSHNTNILAVCSSGQSPKYRSHNVADSVCHNTALKLLILRGTVHRTNGSGRIIADSLNRIDRK